VGQACYEDILQPGHWHVTEFSDQIPAFIKVGNAINFNTANQGTHNCADEDCPDYEAACKTVVSAKPK
jgi:hypothetical protein